MVKRVFIVTINDEDNVVGDSHDVGLTLREVYGLSGRNIEVRIPTLDEAKYMEASND